DAAYFQPIGHRGVGGGRTGYASKEFLKNANENTFISVMIEDGEAIENIDDIVKVDHIDAFFVSHHDLAQSLGHLGEPDHPAVSKARDKAIAAMKAAGRNPGSSANDQNLDAYLAKGVKFIMVNWNPLLYTAAGNFLTRFQKAAK